MTEKNSRHGSIPCAPKQDQQEQNLKKPIHKDIGGVSQCKHTARLRGGEYCKIFSNAGADNARQVKRLPSSGLAFLLPWRWRKAQSAERRDLVRREESLESGV